jgi:hypothetical protein
MRVTSLAATYCMVTASCSDLAVRNVNDPDIDRVYATASSIETTIGTRFQACHNARAGVWNQMAHLALDGFTSGNESIPRPPIANYAGATPSTYADYSNFGTNGRIAANLVTALDGLIARGGTLGNTAQDLRARAFSFFAIGCHLGWLAMVYDSAAIVTPGIRGDSVPELSAASDVMRTAISMLDSAVAVATQPAATAGFPLPASWMGGNALSRDDFVRLLRSFRARFRAGVARTKAERDAVNWTAVIEDARNAVVADFMITGGTSTGWNNPRTSVGGNNVLSPMYYGMADVSGAYDAWLARPPATRGPILVITPDRRFPQGATRAAQQTSGGAAGTSFSATPYLINRVDDVTAPAWIASHYQFRRLQYLPTAATVGPVPVVTKAEMDLLAAEGYLRRGEITAAATLIDITRVGRGRLPALSGVVTTLSQPVPGGAACVPRVPAPPTFTSTMCGNVWEAMKWEKRLETAVVSYAGWYSDSRGWDDLIQGTALEFPVPYQELNARRHPYYSLGGELKSSALRGTYGF